jgi:hypothetical protein
MNVKYEWKNQWMVDEWKKGWEKIVNENLDERMKIWKMLEWGMKARWMKMKMKDGWVVKHRWKLDEWNLCTKDLEMIDESRWMKKPEKKIDEQMMKDEWEIKSSTWMNEMKLLKPCRWKLHKWLIKGEWMKTFDERQWISLMNSWLIQLG